MNGSGSRVAVYGIAYCRCVRLLVPVSLCVPRAFGKDRRRARGCLWIPVATPPSSTMTLRDSHRGEPMGIRATRAIAACAAASPLPCHLRKCAASSAPSAPPRTTRHRGTWHRPSPRSSPDGTWAPVNAGSSGFTAVNRSPSFVAVNSGPAVKREADNGSLTPKSVAEHPANPSAASNGHAVPPMKRAISHESASHAENGEVDANGRRSKRLRKGMLSIFK